MYHPVFFLIFLYEWWCISIWAGFNRPERKITFLPNVHHCARRHQVKKQIMHKCLCKEFWRWTEWYVTFGIRCIWNNYIGQHNDGRQSFKRFWFRLLLWSTRGNKSYYRNEWSYVRIKTIVCCIIAIHKPSQYRFGAHFTLIHKILQNA